MNSSDPLGFASWICGVLADSDVPYVIGGSVASSFYGEPRSTLDVDFMIDSTAEQLRAIVTRFSERCYADLEQALDALSRGTSFNIIDLKSLSKADFFFASDSFSKAQLARRVTFLLPNERAVAVYAPEDILVRKLLWFRLGNETSERQWRDVIGLLRGTQMDLLLLRRIAADGGVSELLERAVEASNDRK